MFACRVMGNTSRQMCPWAIEGPQDAPRSYNVHTDGIPFIWPNAKEKQNSAIWNSDIFHINVFASKPGNIKSANESSGATIGVNIRGTAGADMNKNGPAPNAEPEACSALTTVNDVAIDSIKNAAVDPKQYS